MYTKRIITLLFIVAAAQGAFCQTSQQDPYSEKLATSYVSGATPIFNSMHEKDINRLGDRAAVAVIRYLGAGRPRNPEEVRRILTFIKLAFAAPKTISSDEDLEPKATWFLLQYMESVPFSNKVSSDLAQTRKYVSHQVDEYKRSQSAK